MRFSHAVFSRALRKQKAAVISELREVKKRVFARKSSKPIVAGIALGVVGITTAVAFALAVDPGTSSKIDYAMNFNGSSYLTSTQQIVPDSADFTVEAYAKVTAPASNMGYVWSTGVSGGSTSNTFGLVYGVGSSGASDGACVVIADGTAFTNCVGPRVPMDDWVHLGLTYTQSTKTYVVYMNGTAIYTGTRSTGTQPAGFAVGKSATSAIVQSGFNADNYFKGAIDEVKVFNNVRTQAAISGDAYAYLAPSTGNLTADYDFNEGVAGAGLVYDRTSNNNDLTINGTATFTDIAQVVSAPATHNGIFKIRLNRSYLTASGGWALPSGATSLAGMVYGAGGGGGGGASDGGSINSGGGGGGGAGAKTAISLSTTSGYLATVKVGLGGVGGAGQGVWMSVAKAGTGTAGGASQLFTYTAAGGNGGWGGGFGSGTATYTAGLGGKGGSSGAGTAGSTNTTLADGGAGASPSGASNNSRTPASGYTDTYIGGVFLVGGYGGFATNSALTTYQPTAASGSGGTGGKASDGGTDGYFGSVGASGSIVLQYTASSGTQDFDYLYTFNGTNQYAETDSSSTAMDVTGDFTLEAWVNPSTTCSSAVCVIAGRDNDYLLGTSNGTYRWRITTSTGGSAWYDTGIPVTVGQWQHAALVRSGASVLFYLNGQLMSTQTNGERDASGVTIAMTATSQVGIGWFEIAAHTIDHTDLFAGGIDEVRVWNIARTATSIGDATNGDFNRPLTLSELSNANLLAYWSMNDTPTQGYWLNQKASAMNNTDLTYFGAPTAVTNGNHTTLVNQYLSLNSANSQTAYATDSPAFELTGSNFTVSAWWKIQTCGSVNYLLSKASTYYIGTDTSCNIGFALDPGNEGDATTYKWISTNANLSAAVWHYVSLVKVGTTAYVYVDGALAATVANGDSVTTLGGGNITAVIPAHLGDRNTYFGVGSTGSDSTRANLRNQDIDDVRIWSTDRRTNQGTDMYGMVAHTSAGLKAMFTFDTLVGNYNFVPNNAAGSPSSSILTTGGTSLSAIYSSATPPDNQPTRSTQLFQRSYIQSSTQNGLIPTGATSNDYWLAGGGGGGGAGGNSGLSGGGGGAGGLVEGTATGLATGTPSMTATTQKIGVGGRYAVNDGDAVTQGATNGYATVFTSGAGTFTANGGGAGGSGTTTPAGAPQGANGGSGGGSGQTGGAGGVASQGNDGGAGSTAAAGGGGGARSAGADAIVGAGGAGGAGFLLPYRSPFWAQGGGTGFGSNSAVNSNSTTGATAAGSDATVNTGSGGGGAGFTGTSTATVRGGLGSNGFMLLEHFMTQVYLSSGPTSIQSGMVPRTPFVASLRDINGNIVTGTTDTIRLDVVSGCTLGNGGSTTANTNGQVQFDGFFVYSTTSGTCKLKLTEGTSLTTFIFSLPIRTSPTSITVSTGPTTGNCAWASGYFYCPDPTAAVLNVDELNNHLNSDPEVYLVSRAGPITVNSGLTIGGSSASLLISGHTGLTLNSGIALTGSGKGMTFQTLTSASTVAEADGAAGAPIVFSTNGGAILIHSSAGSTSSNTTTTIGAYTSWLTNGGNFTVSGGPNPLIDYSSGNSNAQTSPQTNGIYVKSGVAISTGSGSVNMRGKYNGLYSGGGVIGNGIEFGSGSSITTTSGVIQLTGGATANLPTGRRAGLYFNPSVTLSTDSGAINLDADTNNDQNSTGADKTVSMYFDGSTISSNSGAITLNGKNAAAGTVYGGINFASATTIGSATGAITINNQQPAPSVAQPITNLTLTGSGNHKLAYLYPSFPGNTFHARGTGNFTLTSSLGTTPWAAAITLGTGMDLGTDYGNISILDAGTQANAVQLDATLTAKQAVVVQVYELKGSGAVIAPSLGIKTTYASGTGLSKLTGASDVDTLAINRVIGPSSEASIGITDADGWTPGDVGGITAVYGVANRLSMKTQPSSGSPSVVYKNQVLPTQPVLQIVDNYALPLGGGNLTGSGYSITPAVATGTNTLSPLTAVTSVAGIATFSGMKFSATGSYTIGFTASPTLPGTNSVTSAVISIQGAGNASTFALDQTTISGTSGIDLPALTATYYDAYGNVATSVAGGYGPTITLATWPAGATSGAKTQGNFTNAASGVSTMGNKIRLVGPTGTYTLTIASTLVPTQITVTVNLSGWGLNYGASSLQYKVGTYPATFQGNGTGAVTYTSSTMPVCTVDPNTGDMTPVKTGTCTITASQAASGSIPLGTATSTVTITQGTQAPVTLTASPATLVYGSSITLSGVGGSGNGTFSYNKVSGNCSIGGSSLSYGTANAGEVCVVTATRGSDTPNAVWATATSANYSFTVAGAAQAAVTVQTGKTVGYGNATDLTDATYKPSGGSGTGDWIFSTNSPNCLISGNYLTSTTAIGGTCVIDVQKAATNNYSASTTVQMTVTTGKGSQTVSYSTIASAVRVNDQATLSATATSGLTATFALGTGSSAYCSLSGATVTFTAPGTCVINASQAGDTYYNAATAVPISYTVSKALQTITFGPLADDVVRTTTKTVSGTSTSGLSPTYSVGSNTTNSACTVTSAGVVSLNALGTCEIIASQVGSSLYEAATSVAASFTIAKGTQSTLAISSSATTTFGQNITLTATGGNGSNSYTWTATGDCTIQGSNTLVPGAVGAACEVTVNRLGDANWFDATPVSQTITINKAAQTALTITNPNTVVYGNQLALTHGGGSGNGAVTWSTVAPCSVSGTNLSVGNAGVSCVVTLTKDGDDSYLAATATLTISVTKAQQAPVVIDSTNHVAYRGTIALSASGGSGTGAITFATTGTCSIGTGDILSVGNAGSNCVVTATRLTSTNYLAESSAPMTITIDKLDQTIGAINSTGVVRALGSITVAATSDAGLTVDFTIDSGSSTVCSVSGSTVTLLTSGTCVVNANQVGDTNFNAAPQVQRSFTVAHASQAITLVNPGQKRYQDASFSMSGSASSSLSVSYSLGSHTSVDSNNANVCSVSSTGTVQILEVGTCEIVADQSGDVVYDPAPQASVTFTITKALQSAISLSSTDTYVYGQSLQLTATGGSGTGAFSFATSTGVGCSIDQQTNIISGGNAASSCLVRVTKAADDHFEAIQTDLIPITITKASQSINFTSSPNNATALGTYAVTASTDSLDTIAFAIDSASSSVCSIAGSTVTFLTSGSCVINADQAGNTNYSAAPRVQQTITVAKATQTITFTAAATKKFGDPAFAAVASASSGLTITFGLGSGTTNSACSVAADGTVTILDVGVCEVKADQAGNATYAAAATSTQSINIDKGVQASVAMSSANSVVYGQTLTLTATGGSGGGSFSFEATGDCTLSNGVLTVGIVGSACQVRAIKATDNQYLVANSAWQTITVTKANQSALTITSTDSVAFGGTITLTVSGGSGPTSLSYATTGTCSVTSGVLHVGNAGSACTVTATNAASNNFEAVSSQAQTVTITKAANTVRFTSAAVSPTALGTYNVTATADSGDSVVLAINTGSNTVCSVAGSTVSFLTSGSCVIEASEDGNNNFDAASTVQQTVTVAHAAQTITFTATGSKRFGSGNFTAAASSNSGLAITYSTGAGTTNSACSVASDGTVTILDVGICQITANQSGNTVYAAAAAVNQDVTIDKGIQATLTMSSSSTDAYDSPLTLTAAGGSGSGAVTFAATGACTINNGILTVGVVGSACSVTATKAGDSQYEQVVSAAQTITTIRGTQAALTIVGNAHQTYGATQILSTSGGSGNGSVAYTTGSGCSIIGDVLSVGGGGSTCQVLAHKAASANYNAIDSAYFFVTVDKADQTITSHSTASQPKALDFYTPTAVASSGLSVVFSVDSSTSSVCHKHLFDVVFDTSGTCKVIYTQAGDSNFNVAPQAQEIISVAKLDQSITGPVAFTVHYGTADFQIQASASSNLAIAYTLNGTTTNNSCTISSTGVVHIVTTGICAWTMSQAGDAVYNPTTSNIYQLFIDRAQQAAVTLTTSATTGEAFSTITVSAAGGSGTGAFSYATLGTCTVSGTTVTLGAAGSQCEVYAIKARDDNYADEASAATTITVTRATQATLAMSSASSVAYGGTITLSTSGGSGDGAVTYATTGTCSVNNGVLTVGNAASACTVTATKAQSANYLVASSATQTITINKADQIVTFTSRSDNWEAIHYIVPTFSSNSGLPLDVSIDPSASTVCAMSGNSVNLLTSGTCIIHANQAGNANYNPLVEITQSAYVTKIGQMITVGDVPRHYVGDQPFPLYGQSTGFNYVYFSLGAGTTNNSCSVNANTGWVTILAPGTCEVNVDNPGDASYEPAPTATITFPIGKGTQAPLVITNATPVTYGTVVNLLTTGGTISGTVNYATTGTCSVTGQQLTVGDAGSLCTITASMDGNNHYLPVTSATVTVVIERATQAALTISAASSTVAYGSTVTLATSGGSGDGAVTYAVNGSCSVANGILTLGSAATICTVTPTKAQSTNYLQKVGTDYTFTVAKTGQSIAVTSTPSSSVALDTYSVLASATSGLNVDFSIATASASVCSISGNTVTFLIAGSCVINADQPGDGNFYAATRVQQTITVTKKAQTITFPQVATQQFGAAAVSLTATAASALQVTYAVDAATTNSACSVDNTNQTVSLLGAGDCYLTADQAGNDTWSPSAQAAMHFTITRGNQATLTISSASSVVFGNTISLTTSGGSGNGLVTYATTGICSVNGSTLTVGDAGSSCSVTATKAQDTNYLVKTSAAQTVTITRASQSALTITSAATVAFGGTISLTTSGGSGDGLVSYATTGTCTVAGSTLTVGHAGSSCAVTATKAQSTNYSAESSTAQTITITATSQTVTFTTTDANPIALGSYTVAATATSGLTVSFTVASGSSTVCSISGSTVSYLTSGSCVLNANQAGNGDFTAATQVQQTINVTTKAQALTFPTPVDRPYGSADFQVVASFDSGLAPRFGIASSSAAVCSITSTGMVSILDVGNCVIEVGQDGNSIWTASATQSKTVRIGQATQATLAMTSGSTVVYGNTLSLTSSGGTGTGAVTYATTGTCSVNGSTLTVGNAGSACTVTATQAADSRYFATTSAAQTITITRATQSPLVLSSIASVTYGQTLALSTTGGSGDGAVSYTATGSCSVSGSTLTGGPAGSNCVVFATKAQSLNYNAIDSATSTQSVAKSTQTINLTSSPISPTALQTYTVVATSTSGLTPVVTVDNSSSSVCSVSGLVVSFLTSGNCSLNIDQSGNTNFLAASQVSQAITVAHAAQTITFAQPVDLAMYATAPTFGATASSSLAVTYAVTANGAAACSITGAGALTALTPGLCEISVSQAGNAVYAPAVGVVRGFNIIRAVQTALTITSANTVSYLGTIPLTATGGSGTGAISFTANGTCSITNGVLSVGEVGSSCSVTATRAGDTNYNAVTSASQNVTVTQIYQEPIIVMSAAHVRYGQTLPLVSAGGSGTGAETWAVDTTSTPNSANCAINGSALTLSATTSGDCDIVVTKAASRNYRVSVSPRFSVTVDKAIQSITFTSAIPADPVSGGTYTVAASASSGLALTYSVSYTSAPYCSIAGNVVTFIATGDCVIDADQAGDGRYLAAPTTSQTIAIGSKNQTIAASAVVDHRFGDAAFVITATTPATSTVTFAVGPNTTASACSVNASGVVQVLAVGHCEIVIDAPADAQYAAASAITRVFDVVADQAGAPFVTSISANNQEVTASFLAPTYTGGVALRGYGINAYLNGVLVATTSSCLVTDTSCTITGLTNGVDYTIAMFAINAAGDGALSVANGPIRPATRAQAVQRLVAVGVNTALDVSWAAPASLGGGTFDSYRIYVRPRGGTYPTNPTEQIFDATQTSKQIIGLINGQSYDVKVVTITSANTLQLVSNTAEVIQYPKTIPDAPQAVTLAPISSSRLLISWADPASDGGDAIQSYLAAVVGGQSCAVVPGANLCEVSGLVAGTTYRVEVTAVNGAGVSQPGASVITFRAASVTAPPVVVVNGGTGNGGGSSVNGGSADAAGRGEIWIAFERAATAKLNGTKQGQWISRIRGGKAIFSGTNLNTVKKILVDETTPVRIISQSDSELVVQVPAGVADGDTDIWFYATGHTVRYMHAITYVSELGPVIKNLSGFKKAPTSLSKGQRVQLKKMLPAVKAHRHVVCRGTTKDAWLACKYLKTLRPTLGVKVVKIKANTHTKAGQSAYKSVELTFTK